MSFDYLITTSKILKAMFKASLRSVDKGEVPSLKAVRVTYEADRNRFGLLSTDRYIMSYITDEFKKHPDFEGETSTIVLPAQEVQGIVRELPNTNDTAFVDMTDTSLTIAVYPESGRDVVKVRGTQSTEVGFPNTIGNIINVVKMPRSEDEAATHLTLNPENMATIAAIAKDLRMDKFLMDIPKTGRGYPVRFEMLASPLAKKHLTSTMNVRGALTLIRNKGYDKDSQPFHDVTIPER